MKTINKELFKISPNIMAAAVSPGAISVSGKYLNKIEESEPNVLHQFFRGNKSPIGRLIVAKKLMKHICSHFSDYNQRDP